MPIDPYEDNKRYFLKTGKGPWEHVSMVEWVSEERSAGFWPKGKDNGQPATGGFSSGPVRGSIYNLKYGNLATLENYDPEYALAIRKTLFTETLPKEPSPTVWVVRRISTLSGAWDVDIYSTEDKAEEFAKELRKGFFVAFVEKKGVDTD